MIFNRHKAPKKGLQVTEYVDSFREYKKALETEIGKLDPSQKEEYENAKHTFEMLLKKSITMKIPNGGSGIETVLSPEEDDAMERNFNVMTGYEGMMKNIIGKKGIKIPPSVKSYTIIRFAH
jgi:hypothetical protein